MVSVSSQQQRRILAVTLPGLLHELAERQLEVVSCTGNFRAKARGSSIEPCFDAGGFNGGAQPLKLKEGLRPNEGRNQSRSKPLAVVLSDSAPVAKTFLATPVPAQESIVECAPEGLASPEKQSREGVTLSTGAELKPEDLRARRAGSLEVANVDEQSGESGWRKEQQGLPQSSSDEELQAKTLIDGVNASARRYGVRVGHSLAEARVLVAHLQVCELPRSLVKAALERVAESILRFGTVVSIDRDAIGVSDTVWVEITGVAHLFSGEQGLTEELAAAVGALGHRVRVAVADGPLLSQAFARWWAVGGPTIIKSEDTASSVKALPIQALPVPREPRAWLARLGVLTFGDLERIPRKVAAARLGIQASTALDLVQGIDKQPLRSYSPMRLLSEESSWEESSAGVEPLLFALRGLTARICARLEGRAQAAQQLRLTIHYDAAIAKFRGVKSQVSLDYDLAAPLYHADDLWRVSHARLSRLRLAAPCSGLQLEVAALVNAHQRQLTLANAQSKLDPDNPEALAVLFGELTADIGKNRFGLLHVADSHRPEGGSLLRPISVEQIHKRALQRRQTKRRSNPVSLPKEAVRLTDQLTGLGDAVTNSETNDEVDGLLSLVTSSSSKNRLVPLDQSSSSLAVSARTKSFSPSQLSFTALFERGGQVTSREAAPVNDAKGGHARNEARAQTRPTMNHNSNTPKTVPSVLRMRAKAAVGNPVTANESSKRSKPNEWPADVGMPNPSTFNQGLQRQPNRLLPKPVPFGGAIRLNNLVPLGNQLYSIEAIHFEKRLEGVEWWSSSAVSRDYLRVCLSNSRGCLEALVYVDRRSGERYLHALYD